MFLLLACQSEGVSRLIYTSTYNVVFGGQEIVDGDETLPYLSLDKVCLVVNFTVRQHSLLLAMRNPVLAIVESPVFLSVWCLSHTGTVMQTRLRKFSLTHIQGLKVYLCKIHLGI